MSEVGLWTDYTGKLLGAGAGQMTLIPLQMAVMSGHALGLELKKESPVCPLKAGVSAVLHVLFLCTILDDSASVKVKACGPNPAQRFILSGPREPLKARMNFYVEDF